MTTSLYGTTPPTGEVASGNFTTLYSGAAAAVPVQVSGNTTYEISSQGVSGGANLLLTGSDGSSDFVKYASGTFITVSSTDANTITIDGVGYTQNASAVSGGANLNLVGSDSSVDSVKFASGTGITVSRTDASTITITNSASAGTTYTIDASTVSGGANFNLVGSDSTTDTIKFAGSGGTTVTRTDANTITISSAAPTGGDVVGPASSTDNAIARFDGTTGKIIQNSTVTIADTTGNIVTNGDIAVNGGDVTTTATTASLFNTTATTLNVGGAATTMNVAATGSVVNFGGDINVVGGDITAPAIGIANLYNSTAIGTINIGNSVVTEVNIGNTVGSRVQIKSPTIVGNNATQNVFDTVATTVNAFGAATAVNIGAATGVTTIAHDLTVNGGNINLNGTATQGIQPFLTFETQAAGANPQYGIRGKSALNDPWFVGSGSVGADQGYLEIATGDNAGTPSSGGQIYARQYNNGGGTGVPWEGGTGTVVNELVLLDDNGDTSVPNNLTVGDNITLNSDKADVNVDLTFGRSGLVDAVIRWNSTSDSFEWSADGTTWYDFINANLTAPFYNGQLLSYRNGEWVNDNRVDVTDANERNAFNYRPLSPSAGVNTTLYLRKDYSNAAIGTPGVGTYADGAGVSLSFQVVSDTQAPPSGSAGQANAYANITGVYSSTVPTVSLRTSINNGASFTSVADFTTLNASFIGSLTVESRSDIDTATLTTTAITQVPLITSTRNVMKAVVYIVQGANVHTVEALVLKTGTSTAMVTTYGEMYNTSALATFNADTSGGSIRLLVTPANSTSMLFTAVITSLT